jgi:SAM-dependent methyltransferase
MTTDPLYNDHDFTRFYDLDNGWGADLAHCAGLAEGAGSVLDLGCGTGLFLASLPVDKRRVGVDPAAAMIDIARRRPGGETVEWIVADARGLDLGERFDLVTLTGHAFQVFLTDDDRRAVLRTIAGHLAPGGTFIFDTRNPAVEEWRDWTPDRSAWAIVDPELGPVDAWNDVDYDPNSDIVTYQTHYRVRADGQHFAATSRIAFPDKAAVTNLLTAAGLTVHTWLGDWEANPYDGRSPEIIPIGGLAGS